MIRKNQRKREKCGYLIENDRWMVMDAKPFRALPADEDPADYDDGNRSDTPRHRPTEHEPRERHRERRAHRSRRPWRKPGAETKRKKMHWLT
jgi:hypothetical protein